MQFGGRKLRTRRRLAALGPWYTKYVIDGHATDGEHDYTGDPRIDLFFRWTGEPRTILELSSYEAGHSLLLAEPPFVQRVLGLEGRVENVRRASYAADRLGKGNIEFVKCDLEDVDLTQFGRFEAVFCTGLLYHLVRPWLLIEQVAKVTDSFFLDTHYARHPDTVVDGHEGAWFAEGGYNDRLSGLSERSFWMSMADLTATLQRVGLDVVDFHDHDDWNGGGPRVLLLARRQAAASGT
jgi:hypothetical protein